MDKTQIEKITLTKEQSTKIFADILLKYDDLMKRLSYSAPEVIKAQVNQFLWDIYILGRRNEKDDILKLLP